MTATLGREISNPSLHKSPPSQSADFQMFNFDHKYMLLIYETWERGIFGFACRMSINITWSLSCYLPHLYAGLTLWFVYLSYNRKFAVRICTRLVWPGEPASVIILELESPSQQSASNCSPDTKYWHFRVSQAMTTFNEMSSYCEMPATLNSLFWISVIFTRSFAR